jgi:hypothetical protein
MKIKTHPYFEILTKNNLCPFCRIKFPQNKFSLQYGSKDTNCKTCDFHRVISHDESKIAFNVRLGYYNLQGGELWHTSEYLLIWSYVFHPKRVHIEIPIFDLFNYTLQELETKVKGYLLFS